MITGISPARYDETCQRRKPRMYTAPKLTPWCQYDLDFCMWLQADFDRLVSICG